MNRNKYLFFLAGLVMSAIVFLLIVNATIEPNKLYKVSEVQKIISDYKSEFNAFVNNIEDSQIEMNGFDSVHINIYDSATKQNAQNLPINILNCYLQKKIRNSKGSYELSKPAISFNLATYSEGRDSDGITITTIQDLIYISGNWSKFNNKLKEYLNAEPITYYFSDKDCFVSLGDDWYYFAYRGEYTPSAN